MKPVFYSTPSNPITEIIKDSLELNFDYNPGTTRKRYISYNSDEVISYQVYKDAISPYHGIRMNSALYEQHPGGFRVYNDSVVSYKNVSNGKAEGN